MDRFTEMSFPQTFPWALHFDLLSSPTTFLSSATQIKISGHQHKSHKYKKYNSEPAVNIPLIPSHLEGMAKPEGNMLGPSPALLLLLLLRFLFALFASTCICSSERVNAKQLE